MTRGRYDFGLGLKIEAMLKDSQDASIGQTDFIYQAILIARAHRADPHRVVQATARLLMEVELAREQFYVDLRRAT